MALNLRTRVMRVFKYIYQYKKMTYEDIVLMVTCGLFADHDVGSTPTILFGLNPQNIFRKEGVRWKIHYKHPNLRTKKDLSSYAKMLAGTAWTHC